MKLSAPSILMVLLLSGCAGGLPPSSSNGLNEYDVVLGLKSIPEGADPSRIWSPIHQIYGGKPEWSVVWFKEKTKNGKVYELTAQPTAGQAKQAQTGAARPSLLTRLNQLTETASLYVGEIKSWVNKITNTGLSQ